MFTFTKEQKQKKLANQFYSDYCKLSEQLQHNYKSDLTREAISNAMADIVDGFTLLRITYDLSKQVKTTKDYRLLRVPEMPGIVLDYYWIANDLKEPYVTFYSKYVFNITPNIYIKDYLYKAILNKNKKRVHDMYIANSSVYGVTEEFSIKNFNTLESLIAFTKAKTNKVSSNYVIVGSKYSREICEQFAHNQNIDILISI